MSLWSPLGEVGLAAVEKNAKIIDIDFRKLSSEALIRFRRQEVKGRRLSRDRFRVHHGESCKLNQPKGACCWLESRSAVCSLSLETAERKWTRGIW